MEMPSGAAITVRERVLLDLARRKKSNLRESFRAITEAAAVVLDVARVSVWELIGGPEPLAALECRMVCRDLYLLDERKHVTFLPVYGRDFPAYVRAIHARRTIAADDARADPRTREFTEFYLRPLGITSMMDVPIWHHGEVYGVLCFEHIGAIRHWRADEESFATHMADIVSGWLEAAEHDAVTRRWEAVIESLAEGVAIVDAQGVIVQSNAAARRALFDAEPGRTMEDGRSDVDLVDAADRPISMSDWPFHRVLRHEIVQGEIYGVVYKRTGEHRYVRVTASPVMEDGQLKFVVFVIVDATEEMLVERLKQELLSGLAHELKTPLAVAKGYAQQIASESSSDARARMLDAIVRACDRMDHLSETLLDLASMILGRLQLTRERVDLGELVLSALRREERAAPSHHFQLNVQPNIWVVVDCTRVRQAIRQVLQNAVAYSPAGSTIEVGLMTAEGVAIMSVRDYGIGIPEDEQKSIFTLFYRARPRPQRDRGGLGVGLHLAREIVRRHGGEMWFESAEGKGSTFHLRLPLAETT